MTGGISHILRPNPSKKRMQGRQSFAAATQNVCKPASDLPVPASTSAHVAVDNNVRFSGNLPAPASASVQDPTVE